MYVQLDLPIKASLGTFYAANLLLKTVAADPDP